MSARPVWVSFLPVVLFVGEGRTGCPRLDLKGGPRCLALLRGLDIDLCFNSFNLIIEPISSNFRFVVAF